MRNRRRKIIGAAVGFVFLLGLSAFFNDFGPREPVYDGKPMSYWFTEILPASHLDTNAIPFLLHVYETADGPVRRQYRKFWLNLPHWVKPWLPHPRETDAVRSMAMHYLLEIRAFKSPTALPTMVRLIQVDPDAGIRQGAAYFLGESQTKDPTVINALVQGLKDNDSQVRWFSSNALLNLAPSALTNAVK